MRSSCPACPTDRKWGTQTMSCMATMAVRWLLWRPKRTCVDVAKGRQQAKLYADILEQKYHRRPVIFLTNGFETRITDNLYPERKCAAIYSSAIWRSC